MNKYGSVKNFFDFLVTAKNLIADIYIDDIYIKSCVASFGLNSGYIMANIDIRFALTELISFNKLLINIHEASNDITIIESLTNNLSEYIPQNDIDADLRFKVGNRFPYNELKYEQPVSYFNSM